MVVGQDISARERPIIFQPELVGKTMDNVILKPIPISPSENYMAGSDGRIYSRTRYKGFGEKDFVDWYLLAGCKNGEKEYLTVSLCHNNVRVTRFVHRLVCMAFHGVPEKKSLQVRHLDGNSQNNKPENLKWGTHYENWLDRKMHNRMKGNYNHPNSKTTTQEREHIRWAVGEGIASRRHIARMMGMSQPSISEICRGL